MEVVKNALLSVQSMTMKKKSTQVEHTSQRVALSWFIVRMKNLSVLIVMRSMVIF